MSGERVNKIGLVTLESEGARRGKEEPDSYQRVKIELDYLGLILIFTYTNSIC